MFSTRTKNSLKGYEIEDRHYQKWLKDNKIAQERIS